MVISRTPLRISLTGGGTDFADYYRINGGAVISSAIDKYIFVIVKKRFDRKIYINYSRKEIVDRPDQIRHDLVRESMKMTGVDYGVEITTLADIPSEGSGLGSSSSVTVGLLHALYSFKGELVKADKLAEEACRIEIDILGAPIGKQDQYIAAYGNLRRFDFLPDDSVENRVVPLDPTERTRLGERLCLFYTNITRQADNILSKQKDNIQKKKEAFDQAKSLVDRAEQALTNRDFAEIGRLLDEGWQKKKSFSCDISNPQIDSMYSAGIAGGATGGKISGAGGGGFLLLYSPLDKLEKVRSNLKQYNELSFKLEPAGSKIIFDQQRE